MNDKFEYARKVKRVKKQLTNTSKSDIQLYEEYEVRTHRIIKWQKELQSRGYDIMPSSQSYSYEDIKAVIKYNTPQNLAMRLNTGNGRGTPLSEEAVDRQIRLFKRYQKRFTKNVSPLSITRTRKGYSYVGKNGATIVVESKSWKEEIDYDSDFERQRIKYLFYTEKEKQLINNEQKHRNDGYYWGS